MGTIARMAVELGMDASGFDAGIAKAQQQTESLVSKLGKAGATMSAAVTLPLAGVATMALKSAGDFESSMNVLQSVSGATAGDMQALTEQALRLGAETSFSAGEAADAMLELGKAGMGTKDIMGAMPGVLSLAAAGNMDVGAAAEIAANAINTFGLDATEAAGVSNMLAAAANASSADVTDLAMGFKMAGSIFASNNQSMSDLTASMSLLANAGIAGSDAGTSLKTMLMRLAAPTDDAAAAMSSLGLNVYNSDGSMRDFEAIVGDLATSTAGLTDSQRNMALTTIFGADAIRAATILADAGADGFASMEAAVTKAGAAEEAAAARMKGLNGAMDYLQGSIDSVLISVGTPFLTMLGDMARYIADLITSFAALPAPVQNAALAFAAVLAAAGPVMLAVSGIGAALAFLLSPIGLVVAGVALLAAAWAMNFGGIQEQTAAAWAAIQPTLQMLVDVFQASLPGAIATGTAAFTGLLAQLAIIGATLQAFFAPAIDRVQTAFMGLPESLAPLLPALQEMGAAFGGLVTAAQPLVMLLGVALAVAADFGVNLMAAAIERLPGIVGPVIDQVTNSVKLISTVISEVTTAIVAIANGDWATAWNSMKSIVTAFQTFVSETWTNITTMVGNVGGAVGDAVVNTLNDMGLTAAATQVQAIIDQVTALGEKIASVLSGKTSFAIALPEWVTTLLEWGWPALPEVPDWLKGMLKWEWPALPAAPAWITTLLAWLWPGFPAVPNWVQKLFDWRWPGLPEAPAWLADLLNWKWPAMPAFNFPSLPGMATGGPVTAGTTYMVGERGPEIFTPNRSGSIIPNDELGGIWGDLVGAGAGGAQVTVNANVASAIDVHALAYQVAAEINRWRR